MALRTVILAVVSLIVALALAPPADAQDPIPFMDNRAPLPPLDQPAPIMAFGETGRIALSARLQEDFGPAIARGAGLSVSLSLSRDWALYAEGRGDRGLTPIEPPAAAADPYAISRLRTGMGNPVDRKSGFVRLGVRLRF